MGKGNITINNMEAELQEKITALIQEAVASAKREMYRADESGTITPEEAVALVGRQNLDEYNLGLKVYNAIQGAYSGGFARGAVFLAGKIYGIRQERARRKKGGALHAE